MTLLGEVYDAFTATVSDLDAEELERPTRASAWCVRELVYHQLLDAQRTLVALASPTEEAPDVDEVTYWRPFKPSEGDGGAAHARFVARVAAAFEDPQGLIGWWATTSAATGRAAAAALAADPGARVSTQGHVITVADLVSTLVVESTIHLLDATLEVPGEPPPAALAHTRRVLELVHGGPLVDEDDGERHGGAGLGDDARLVLLATGRLPSDHPAYPLLG